MTTVVSDTSPINYLLLIGEIDLLPRLFHEVLIPPAVLAELSHPRAPQTVAAWAKNLPAWARVAAPSVIDSTLALDAGETEAISLALELHIAAILIDERQGRAAAEGRGIIAVGTLNILTTADLRGFVDFEDAIRRLKRTSFHVDSGIISALLDKVRARRNSPGN